jgi:hypothetical protein
VKRGGIAAVAAAVALAGAAPLVAGAGDGGDDDRFLPGSQRAGAGGALTQAPEATCAGWRAGSPGQRRHALRDIEAVFSRGGRGAVLPRDRALAAFDRACEPSFAGPWRLWKVYEHALAFQYG